MSERVDYASDAVPSDYICDACMATGCKLWREYQTCFPRLLCAPCAERDQGKRFIFSGRDRSDQIGWYVPAVPTEGNGGYWGYTSVPDAAIEWWRRLPIAMVRPWPKGRDAR